MSRPKRPTTRSAHHTPPAHAGKAHKKLAAVAGCFVLAVGTLFVIENAELFEDLPLGKRVHQALEHAGSLYQLKMRLVPRPLEAHYTTLVSFTRASEGAFSGPCEIRAFLARLIPRIVEMHPAMIVSDIGFARSNCGQDAQETKDLTRELAAASQSVPIVIGRGSEALDTMPEERAEELRRKGYGEDDLIAIPTIPIPGRGTLVEGLIRINKDVKKVPLRWYVHESEDGPLVFHDSLSLAAAKLYRSTFPDRGKRLQELGASGYHPFASFLREGDFSVTPAIRLFCNADHGAAHDWRACGAGEGDAQERRKLYGRILVLGAGDDPNDLWETGVGRLPGFMLQANYLEALLDARAYRPLSLPYQLLVAALWFGLVELPFWWHGMSTVWALALSFLVSSMVMFLLYYVFLVNFAWYVGLAPPSVLAILGRIVYQGLEKKAEA